MLALGNYDHFISVLTFGILHFSGEPFQRLHIFGYSVQHRTLRNIAGSNYLYILASSKQDLSINSHLT
jgi:hypothetical protein